MRFRQILREIRECLLFLFFFPLCFPSLYADGLDEFISLRTFRSIAHHAPDLVQDFNPAELQAGEIFYLRSSHSSFFQEIHPRVTVPYVLITHGNPCEFPGPFEPYLEDANLIVWFAQNLPLEHHPKIVPLPLGVSPHLKKGEMLARERKKRWEKTHLLYVNFLTDTNPQEREPLMERFSNETFCTVRKQVPFEEYLQDLASSCFVLCPRGVALDTFRTWETLYMGSIPIVKSSSLDPVFEGLPVLIVQSWDEVNEAFLLEKWEEMRSQNYSFEKLQPNYWIDQIHKITYLF